MANVAVKHRVAALDEKLSDCGGKDVEDGTSYDSPDISDNFSRA